ncbi:radical SAM protein [archaeon]|jgi:MoaA/NifB/PqqE/SkfB family radical SAM enzyme|nr:radical SAM protein [Candidatus Woesearchaeota archaeon]MBT3465472.1 radical SAM protein [archaeon]MBT4351694.1 radical SAM protein [archaeon]MBT4647516.1 radical SAM protein [archaeon]MBT6821987.1 radical SAM protein [archaeon]
MKKLEIINQSKNNKISQINSPIKNFFKKLGIDSLVKKEIKIQGDIFYFFGDISDLDNRVSGKEKVNFDSKIKNLKEKIGKLQNLRIVIGISRYNFFKVHKICQFILNIFGENIEFDWVKLKVFPMTCLTENFDNYIKEIKAHLPSYIKFEIYDDDFINILKRFEELALQEKDSEPELARLLGVICENAFVGPRVMVIDPHHRCNTNCTHCWVHTPGVSHGSEFLNTSFPMNRFKRMIDDASELKVETIILQGDGEPLLHPNSLDMLRYAVKRGIDVRFFTNGILLNEKVARAVVEIGVKEIYCSFPAGTKETYKKINPIQKPETYDKVVKNLKRLMEIKKEADAQDPRVIVTHVIHTQNHQELVKMAEDDVYEKVDAARFYLIRLDIMNKFLKIKPDEIVKIRNQIPQVEETLKQGGVEFVDNIKFQLENYNSNDGSWSKDIFLKKGCTIGYYFNLVPAKGDVSFCCHLRTVGDLTKQSYKEIWTSNKYTKWRHDAKFMKDNKDSMFLNNQLLYDDHCTHCDNHQTILESYEKMEKYGVYKYYI